MLPLHHTHKISIVAGEVSLLSTMSRSAHSPFTADQAALPYRR